MLTARAPRRLLGATLALILVVTSAIVYLEAAPVSADTAPIDPDVPVTVSADALPTVQINGVVWSQVIANDRVYVTGEFTHARPAGAAPGVDETPRANILAYDLHTGELVESWAPALDAQGIIITASEDGSVIYVGGDFGRVNGQFRGRVAAIDAHTGAVLPFNPVANIRVSALAVTGNTLYMGGHFTTVTSQPRTRLAAVNATTGALLPWAPTADNDVVAMTRHPASGRIIVGGNFEYLNGVQQYGMGSLDGSTGAVMPWSANTIITNRGFGSYISGLTVDGDMVYGTGWTFIGNGGVGNFEGTFGAHALTGGLEWVNGCRGDNYGLTVRQGVVYTAGHAHDCGMVENFPQSEPWTFQRTQAIDTRRSPSGLTNAYGSPNTWQYFPGRPAADILHWLPTVALGNYTGQQQGPWAAASNDDYVVLGGEFPRVNGIAQQGLVRFPAREISPNSDQIQNYTELLPTLTPIAAGTVRVGWEAAWDRDNEYLTVEVLRGATTATSTVLKAFQTKTNWWTRPPLAYFDTSAPAGSNQTYRIRVSDPYGNVVTGPPASITVPGGAVPQSTYASAVKADSPTNHWRLGEASGTTVRDWSNSDDVTLHSSIGRNASGALLNESDPAASFPGTSSTSQVNGVDDHWKAGPQDFSIEAWVRTTTTSGGKIVGFGNSRTGRSASNTADRHIYMSDSGRFYFGVRPDMGNRITINSGSGYNNGQWHHVVGSLSEQGMQLYVDGELVASNPSVTRAQVYWGYWRVGGDRLSSWPNEPSREAINASIDEVAVYPAALTAGRVRAHYQASGRVGNLPNDLPTASFTSQVNHLSVSFNGGASSDPDGSIVAYDWAFGDGNTGSGVAPQHAYETAGTYDVTLTVTDNRGATDDHTIAVTVTDPPKEYALDTFGRTVANGLGNADIGGAWSGTTPASSFSVSGGSGRIIGGVAANRAGYLTSVNKADVDMSVDLSLNTAATGGGAYVSVIGRRVSNGNDYRAQVRYVAGGSVIVSLMRTVGGATTVLGSTTVPGLTVSPNETIRARLQVRGTDSTTARVKVWRPAAAEPQDWLLTSNAATPTVLQQPGHVGLLLYLSGSWTGGAPTLSIDNFVAEEDSTPPPPPPNVPPVAAFSTETNFLSASFDAELSSDSDGTIEAYDWDFGDGNTGTGDSVVHSYEEPGVYQVTLTVTDDDGDTGSIVQAVTAVEAPPPNEPPVAAFTSEFQLLSGSFDGSGSGDSDGTIVSYDWDFGDGTATTNGVTVDHVYPAAGTYQVTLTVTDDDGDTGSVSGDVTVFDSNQPPVANFTSQFDLLEGSFDGSASSDIDGTVESYEWDFGDGNTGTGQTPQHTYAAAGTYQVTLTVTDNESAVGSITLPVTVYDDNQPPAAAFTTQLDFLTASFDGSASSDIDGTIESYEWDFGDGNTGSGQTAQHSYAAAGTYQVTLTVTDDDSDTGSVTTDVTVVDNVAPTASFSTNLNFLAASFDGSASSDIDGTIESYEWDFGDGNTGSGQTAQHLYAAAGTYQVTLTVTDDEGALGTTTTEVTVINPPYVLDLFGRSVVNGLGGADIGGAWTVTAPASSYSVSGDAGRILGAVAANRAGYLTGVQHADVDMVVDLSLDTPATGGGAYVSVIGRRVSNGNDYRAQVRYVGGGSVILSVMRTVGGTSTFLASTTISGLSVNPNEPLRVRLEINGLTTTTVRAKLWRATEPEPATWAVTSTGATPAALQLPGHAGVLLYLSGSWTGPLPTLSIDNLVVGPPPAG